MRCTIDAVETSARCLTRRPMNFGQPVASQPVHRYSVELTGAELARALAGPYRGFIAETIADEPYDEGAETVIKELRALGFPPLEAVPPELLMRRLGSFLALDLRDALFPGSMDELALPAYSLNSLDALALQGDGVCIRGQACRLNLDKLRAARPG